MGGEGRVQMSLGTFFGGLANLLVGTADTAAKAAQAAGAASVKVAGQTVSISALIAQLDQLAKANIAGAVTSLHFANLRDFLLSQQFPSDIVDVSDILGVIGLVVPPVAIAANDLREFAGILTVLHAVASGLLGLSQFFGTYDPDASNPTLEEIFPNANVQVPDVWANWPGVNKPI
jgi:hypothetical protein